MSVQEIPVTFACEGAPLIGVVHVPDMPNKRGVLAIVAGGPQYRAGCCRQLVQMARVLADQGYAVMRFDYCGLGDGAGPHRGFLHIAKDLDAAIESFLKQVPGVSEIVLWGGCDASSAALIHGPAHPKVSGLILGNPFVHNETTHAKVVVKYYYWKRLRDKSFWTKIFQLKLNPIKTARSVYSAIKLANSGSSKSKNTGNSENLPFPTRMLNGATAFKGRVLLLMSGLSLVSKEFDELVKSSPEWQKALSRLNLTRVDFPDADQAFSTIAARDAQVAAAAKWLSEWH
jgi:exosortase A-associated hydrolase 1